MLCSVIDHTLFTPGADGVESDASHGAAAALFHVCGVTRALLVVCKGA